MNHAGSRAVRSDPPHAREQALEPLARGATFHSLAHDALARIDFYRARVVDGLGNVVHERVFAVELVCGAHSRFPGHALTPTGVMAIRCKQFHLPDL